MGSAACLPTDLNKALGLHPGADLIAVNEAAGFRKVDHIVSLHWQKLPYFRWLQESEHGPGAICHAVPSPSDMKYWQDDYPAVDYAWPSAHTRATSGFAGVKLAFMLGYTTVVMAGCPMVGGDGYYCDTHPGGPSDPRLGLESSTATINRFYREQFARECSKYAPHLHSMSGYTRECLEKVNGRFADVRQAV